MFKHNFKGDIVKLSSLDSVSNVLLPSEIVNPIVSVITDQSHTLNKGGVIPNLVIISAIERIKYINGYILLKYMDYKNGFKENQIFVPDTFEVKKLLGTQGKKMLQAVNTFLHKPDWEVALRVVCPKLKRPRRTSLHTLATMLGRKDILALAKEMQDSGKVVGYKCPDVQCLIFYLKDMTGCPGMIDTRDEKVWDKVQPFCTEFPLESVKGFKRFAGSSWSGGSYGKGQLIRNKSEMNTPYEADDFPYAQEIIKELKAKGYTPGIEFINEEDKLICKVIN